MKVFTICFSIVLMAVGCVFADATAGQTINNLFHLTGIPATIVNLILGGGIVGGFLLKGVKPIQDARNIINTLTILLVKLKDKNTLDDEEKEDFNAAIEALMVAMDDMGILRKKIPMMQALKIRIDAMPETAAAIAVLEETEKELKAQRAFNH